MKIIFFILLILSRPVLAKTYDLTQRFGIGGGGGMAIPLGDNRFGEDAEDDFSYNFHARYQTFKSDGLQLNFTNLDFEETDITATVYDLMYLYRINEVDRFTPVLGIGAGVADIVAFDPFDNLKAALRARVGFEYMLTEDLMGSINVDYHYINRMPDDDDGMPIGEMHVLAPQLNLTLFFGHDKEEKVNRAAPKAVAVAGEIDADNDGVVDSKDKCPGTPEGKKINAYGCMEQEKATIQVNVFFDTGKSKLTMNSHDALTELAAFLNEHPGTKLEIQGHTDNTGSKAKNRQLSSDRANAVKVYLIEKLGIPVSRLSAYGFGDEQPVGDNSTPEGRAKNRRVMAVISE